MYYRPEIDGLRAIAVLVVVLFHAGLPSLQGGFVGVDVFFVISGFLITSIVQRELEEGTFSLRAFYVRRMRRILPALFFVMVCTMPLASLWMMPLAFREYSQSLMAAGLSYANIYFWAESGYFAPAAETLPLLHTWSLSLEEQFYLIFPFAMMFLWPRGGKRLALPVFMGVALASLLFSQFVGPASPSANFYLLPGRLWELLAGALCAIAISGRKIGGSDILSFGGLALIVGSVMAFDDTTPFPSFYALVPVAGAALILVFARQGTLMARILSAAPMTVIGRISFSAYLWHQPIFAFARLRMLDTPPLSLMLALTALSFVLAYFTWRYVEEPLRRPSLVTHQPDLRIVCKLSTIGIAIIAFGALGNATHGLPQRLPDAIRKFEMDNTWSRTCLFSEKTGLPAFPLRDCLLNGDKPVRYAIWGDSIASSITPALAGTLKQKKIGLQQLTHGFCAPILGVSRSDEPGARNCDAFNDGAFRQILDDRIDTVFLEASWTDFLDRTAFDIDGVSRTIDPDGQDEIAAKLNDTVRRLTTAGIRVVLVYPHATSTTDVTLQAGALMLKGEKTPEISMTRKTFEQDTVRSRALLDSVTVPGVVRVRPSDVFCEPGADGICVLVSQGRSLLADRRHFTATGAAYVVEAVMTALNLRAAGDKEPPRLF